MKFFEIFVYVFSLGVILSILGLVALKNIHSRLNQSFLIFGFCVFVAVGLSNIAEFSHSATETIWLTRTALLFGDILCMYFYVFTLAFTGWKPRWNWFPSLVYFLAPIFGVLAFFPITMRSVTIIRPSGFITHNGPLLWINLIYILAVFTTSFVVLLLSSKHAENRIKLQIRIMIYGIAGALTVILVAQVVMPQIGIYQLRSITSAPAGLIFMTALSYSVFRQKMFDIRGAVLRSIGYTLSVLIVIGVYVLIVYGVSKDVTTLRIDRNQEIFFVISAIILALLFRPSTKIIKRATSTIFFRNDFNPEELFNKVGHVLATELRIEALRNQICDLLNQYLNTTSNIVILDSNSTFIDSEGNISNEIKNFVNDLNILGEDLLVLDDLPEGQLKKVMRSNRISVAMTLKVHNAKIGYLFLGDKSSGASYYRPEIALIQTIAEEIAVGFQNSRSYSLVQQFNQSLQAKIDKATEDLQVANEKLKENDALKDDFISMASHQLGTPLAVIDGYLSLANSGMYGKLNPKLGKPLADALERAEVMKSLLNDLLDISRMTAGKFVLQLAPTNLSAMVLQEVSQLQPIAKKQDTELIYHQPQKDPPELNIDPRKTSQVVMNLVNNALQYAPGGKVDVYLENNDEFCTVRVVDNGIGVPEEEKSKLFTKFYRATNARKELPTGTGIGLYLVKKVVEDQGGSIIFSSEVGKGSLFGFRLPIKKPVTNTNIKHAPELAAVNEAI